MNVAAQSRMETIEIEDGLFCQHNQWAHDCLACGTRTYGPHTSELTPADPTHDAIDTLAAYHRQCAECCALCNERQCDCDICKTYRKTDRERETYFQDLIARVGEHAAYAYWQQARTLAPLPGV